MAAAFIERRPKSFEPKTDTSHFVIVLATGVEIGRFKTEERAKIRAFEEGFRPVHVSRASHLQDRDQPTHWRVADPCRAKHETQP
jgi:hypothetical protein